MALPQFGIYSDTRVCSDCFNGSSRLRKDGGETSSGAIATATDNLSGLNLDEDTISEAKSTLRDPVLSIPECKCGMPLCICEAPIPDPVPLQMHNTAAPVIQSNPRPKKSSSNQLVAGYVSKKPASSSTAKPSSFFNLGQASNASSDKSSAVYDVTGEGLREAIKNSDATAVKRLLTEGVDANYCDKQGLTLLHLATLFNQTEIAFILMDHGANVECKNAQGETPIDIAPTMLQYKMRQKIEESYGNARTTES